MYQKITLLIIMFLIQIVSQIQYTQVKKSAKDKEELIERIVRHSLDFILVFLVGGMVMCNLK